jgi:hypothetical protein
MVEYYMLLEATTLFSAHPVNRLQFRLADEYSFPSIKTLDGCEMIGAKSIKVPNC